MAVSKREEALAAVASLLSTIPGVKHLRTPSFELGSADLPYVAIVDGEEEIANLMSGILSVTTQCTVVIGVRQDSQQGLGTALNDLLGKVRAAIGSNPTLDNKVIAVDYVGADEPDFDRDANAPPQAVIALSFSIRREEAEHDPYAYH